MRIQTVTIHNFHSFKDEELKLENFSLLAGENNAGKSNLIAALRVFYEDGGLKFSDKRDFPKFETSDNESWIEIEFRLTPEETDTLKDEYRGPDSSLRVRKYLRSDNKERFDPKQSNIYGYENNELSANLFYGAKNFSARKLGEVIYIPELAKMSDTLKLSGPSPLRDLTNFVFKKIVATSQSFSILNSAISAFNDEFRDESDNDDITLNRLVSDINAELEPWEIDFGLRINDIKPEDVVKNLLEHYVRDRNLAGEEVDVENLGQGLQRHIVYTLIRIGAKYVERKEPAKKDFAPDLTLLLFEEPEAFLHPTQQEVLNRSLRALSSEIQVLLTTHSPVYVSRNVWDVPSIARITKSMGASEIHQIGLTALKRLIEENTGLYRLMSELLSDPGVDDSVKKTIRNRYLGDDNPDLDAKTQEESFGLFLWPDGERSSAFFAKKVLICEGATEKVLFDYLIREKWQDVGAAGVYVLDAMGKFNFHRFMNLFGEIGITHSVLYDGDPDKPVQQYVNAFLEANLNKYTAGIDHFDREIESELGIELPRSPHQKPVHVLRCLNEGQIANVAVERLHERIAKLLEI